ncbi:hypothetical protein HAV22_21310 [Massilia sp. TW-1]|uniref:Uncharacterized protein n=1 Tax=Telluria antibiotica TaxID=2717319 RepID=A0ABX0PGL0_9BURK|nr:hypothetical protein [Telluria antibiotica]NIA56175.1 hypothetical protein [Telluria antibiotica]
MPNTGVKDWPEKLVIPMATLLINAAMTYGVVSTQLQWIRADLDRQQQQIDRLQGRLFKPVGDER